MQPIDGQIIAPENVNGFKPHKVDFAIMYVSKGNAKHVLGGIIVNAHATF